MTTNCGDLWWLCGPVFNLTSPMYWIASVAQAGLFYWLGKRAAEREMSTCDRGPIEALDEL